MNEFLENEIHFVSSFLQDWKFFRENHMQTDQKVGSPYHK